MDPTLELILAEVKATRAEQAEINRELKQHIKEEGEEFKSIRKDINCLKTQTALHKQQAGYFTAFISLVVAAVVSTIASLFSHRP